MKDSWPWLSPQSASAGYLPSVLNKVILDYLGMRDGYLINLKSWKCSEYPELCYIFSANQYPSSAKGNSEWVKQLNRHTGGNFFFNMSEIGYVKTFTRLFLREGYDNASLASLLEIDIEAPGAEHTSFEKAVNHQRTLYESKAMQPIVLGFDGDGNCIETPGRYSTGSMWSLAEALERALRGFTMILRSHLSVIHQLATIAHIEQQHQADEIDETKRVRVKLYNTEFMRFCDKTYATCCSNSSVSVMDDSYGKKPFLSATFIRHYQLNTSDFKNGTGHQSKGTYENMSFRTKLGKPFVGFLLGTREMSCSCGANNHVMGVCPLQEKKHHSRPSDTEMYFLNMFLTVSSDKEEPLRNESHDWLKDMEEQKGVKFQRSCKSCNTFFHCDLSFIQDEEALSFSGIEFWDLFVRQKNTDTYRKTTRLARPVYMDSSRSMVQLVEIELETTQVLRRDTVLPSLLGGETE